MKFRFVLLLVIVMAGLSTGYARTPVKVFAKDAFIYVKMTHMMLGGNIEIRDSTGHVVSSKTIDHRKMLMDFFDLADGTYNVTVKHDDLIVEFRYSVDSPQRYAKRVSHFRNYHTELLSEKPQIRLV